MKEKYTVHLPRFLAEHLSSRNFDDDGEACLISISEPGKPEARLMPGWTDVLRMSFWDVTKPLEQGFVLAGHPAGSIDPMTEDEAKEIADFIKKHKDENIIVHCRAGKSRSAAIVRLLTELGWKMHPTILPHYDFSGFNIHVYSLVKRHFPELLPDGAV